MPTLKQIQREEIKFFEFPVQTDFEFLNYPYRVRFTEQREVGLDEYVQYVRIFKNGQKFNYGEICQPRYIDLATFDNRFLFIPFQGSYQVFDLLKQTSILDDVNSLIGNQFDKTGKFLLTSGSNEYKLTDLETGKVVLSRKDEKLSISEAHFGCDNLVWTINKNGDKTFLEKIDPASLTSSLEDIWSPFEFFEIDIAQYKRLIDQDANCLWMLPDGGMSHSRFFNNWQYIKTKDKIVYASAIPISEIRRSDYRDTYICDAEYRYVTIEC